MRNLIIIDKNNKLPKNYFKYNDMINIGDVLIELNTYKEFIKLRDYLYNKGINIEICNKRCIDNLDEHITGLLIDVNIDLNIVEDELYKFGFIIRYKDRNIIRYVGCVVACLIYKYRITLEDYLNNFGFVLLIDKEKDLTSFDVVNKLSHIFGLKRVGHTGTLDPMASGLLVVCFGKYTKLVNELTSLNKDYLATALFNKKTDTGDITGNVVIESNKKIDKDNLVKVLNSFIGKYSQVVPIYSAKKINGKRLYEYARENIDVELPRQDVSINDIKLLDYNNSEYSFYCSVSKGTYIRSLIEDIGDKLDCVCTMKELRRIGQGRFKIDDSYRIEDIENNKYKILRIEDVLDYPVVFIDEVIYNDVKCGKMIDDIYNISDKVIFNYNNKYYSIYKKENNKLVCYINNL